MLCSQRESKQLVQHFQFTLSVHCHVLLVFVLGCIPQLRYNGWFASACMGDWTTRSFWFLVHVLGLIGESTRTEEKVEAEKEKEKETAV